MCCENQIEDGGRNKLWKNSFTCAQRRDNTTALTAAWLPTQAEKANYKQRLRAQESWPLQKGTDRITQFYKLMSYGQTTTT